MISALPTVTGSTPAAATSTSAANASGGGIGSLTSADFLKLLVAQLQNQDPSAPTKPQDLEAEFSSLTTVSDLGTLNSQVASIQAGAGAAQMAQLSNLIGHQVAYTGNTLTVGSNGSATGAFNLAAAGDANVTITNANNQVVGSLALGVLPAGAAQFHLERRHRRQAILLCGHRGRHRRRKCNGDTLFGGRGQQRRPLWQRAGSRNPGGLRARGQFTSHQRPWRLTMSLNVALSGLEAAQAGLNVTANNLSNATTTGFKAGSAEFQTMYPAGSANALGEGFPGSSSSRISPKAI